MSKQYSVLLRNALLLNFQQMKKLNKAKFCADLGLKCYHNRKYLCDISHSLKEALEGQWFSNNSEIEEFAIGFRHANYFL